jgi:two-component system, OmpR family, sensor histidine kinase ChvG
VTLRYWFAYGSRIRIRLLAVNLFVVLIPALGLEFARVYERQLLDGLERDMQNQAVLVREFLEAALERDEALDPGRLEALLGDAARHTRTRLRLVSPSAGVIVDSHHAGPPEGPEPEVPWLARRRPDLRALTRPLADVEGDGERESEPSVPTLERRELTQAFSGRRATTTRVSEHPPAVFLFLAEPVRVRGRVEAAVYVTRSTHPVLLELYRIRRGLVIVLVVTIGISAALTLALSLSISRPLERLARAARRITRGDAGVAIPTGGGGEISELSSAFTDMTEKLEARHRYISDFAADVAHAFKSPLTSIRGAAELLSEGAADDPAARRRFLENIELDARRLDRLVTRLLELSRIDASDAAPSTVALEELVRNVVRRSQGPAGNLVVDYRAEVALIQARAVDLETALANLIDNALRFSPVDSEVTVRVSSDAAGRNVSIHVIDRGPGIQPAHQPHLFERFFTTDAEGEGSGLGLAIVKSVAEAHGGSASVHSEPGHGSEFVITLPVGLLTSARSGAPDR